MSSTPAGTVEMQLEVVVVPVSDVDRAKAFYGGLGWREDADFDIEAARAALLARGVEVGEIFHDRGGVFHHAGTDGRLPGLAPDRASYGSFAYFSDPDGNGWLLQETKVRLRGR